MKTRSKIDKNGSAKDLNERIEIALKALGVTAIQDTKYAILLSYHLKLTDSGGDLKQWRDCGQRKRENSTWEA